MQLRAPLGQDQVYRKNVVAWCVVIVALAWAPVCRNETCNATGECGWAALTDPQTWIMDVPGLSGSNLTGTAAPPVRDQLEPRRNAVE